MFRITYRTRITSIVERGTNTNEAYLSWTNRERVNGDTFLPTASGVSGFTNAMADIAIVPDIWGLTGNTDNTIVRSRTTIHYTPPFELLMFKDVRGSKDSNFLMYPAAGTSELGTYVDFRLRLLNNSPVDINPNQFLIIDILPRIGDERGSTFNTTLSGPITPPTGYRVYYTTEPITTPETTVLWSTTVPNYGDVTAVRFEMNEGHILERETNISFDMRLNIPNDPNLTNEDIAINTFHTSTNGGNSFIYSNESHIKLFEYTVDGYVFHDLNDDGILDHDVDNIFANHLVELISPTETGYEIIATTTTNDRGFYSFNTLHAGEHLIRIRPPSNLTPITDNIGGTYGANAFDPTTAMSESFILNSTNVHQRINAGFVGDPTIPITGLSNNALLYTGIFLSMLATGTIYYVILRIKRNSDIA